MKNKFILAAASLLLLTGCGGEPTPTATDPNVPSATSDGGGSGESASDGKERSDRGSLIVGVGEPTGYSVDGTQIVDLVVTSIEVDPVCTEEGALPPENGHFVVVNMEVETAPELINDKNPYFMPDMFNVIAENGTLMNGSPTSNAAYACLAPNMMIPGTMDPGQRASGSVVLDVATPTGVLMLDDFADNEKWEWEYPSAAVDS
ncbi:hypothetical protein LJ754_02380 [Arthrobacter sp. zg-Y40]|uniref:hypothetical protein n=1 Tax=Arthrobacter sp. zg-Y40 TaxID=2886939 RepID=UPI001D13BA0C|nr:hypothetical protein [Arthrobacter sp. zg-Y40]MCC3278006.1 hypothetical protein [Arthrobacter sp. zg-Y40]